ncbi:MAG: biotin--[acetyl-CoA-carboxylase] ligase [Coxiella endosymbiont of Dermacentor nuttalli]
MRYLNKELIKILDLLSDGKLHSDITIEQQLNIDQTTIWKAIKKLKSYQIPIKSLKNNGYYLTQPFVLLDKQKIIVSALKKKSIQLELLEKIGSTNDHLKIVSHKNKLVVCIAEMQIKGKGRFYRSWYSPFGQNIYLSLRYSFDKNISELTGLSLVCGLAVCCTIEKTCRFSLPVFIKWPNDIICENKKLAGILIEMQSGTHGFCLAIIGVGLNVNMQRDIKKKIDQDWTSLINVTKTYQDRNELCTELIKNLISYLEDFEKHGLIFFQNLWKEKDYLFNKSLYLITSNQKEFHGIGSGINEQGNLILKLTGGLQKAFSSGEVTLMK